MEKDWTDTICRLEQQNNKQQITNIKHYMFTIDQIKEAAKNVKSGKDFPKLVQDFKKIGITHYDNFVLDGKTNYYGANNFKLEAAAKYEAMKVNEKSSSEKLKNSLLTHQQGKTDYMTFCKESAEAGVEKWTTDLHAMIVIYYDKQNNELVRENIPQQK
jgi:uncharacterized protein YbcV (DUF1398 family)